MEFLKCMLSMLGLWTTWPNTATSLWTFWEAKVPIFLLTRQSSFWNFMVFFQVCLVCFHTFPRGELLMKNSTRHSSYLRFSKIPYLIVSATYISTFTSSSNFLHGIILPCHQTKIISTACFYLIINASYLVASNGNYLEIWGKDSLACWHPLRASLTIDSLHPSSVEHIIPMKKYNQSIYEAVQRYFTFYVWEDFQPVP